MMNKKKTNYWVVWIPTFAILSTIACVAVGSAAPTVLESRIVIILMTCGIIAGWIASLIRNADNKEREEGTPKEIPKETPNESPKETVLLEDRDCPRCGRLISSTQEKCSYCNPEEYD